MCGYARQSLRGLVCLQQTQHTFREPILIYRKVDPNFTTCSSGTLSLVWDVLYDDNCHNIHLGNQFSSREKWIPNFTGLLTWPHIDFQQKIKETLVIAFLGKTDFMSQFQTRQDSSSSEDHTCHISCHKRQMKFMLSLPNAGNLVYKQGLSRLDIFRFVTRQTFPQKLLFEYSISH